MGKLILRRASTPKARGVEPSGCSDGETKDGEGNDQRQHRPFATTRHQDRRTHQDNGDS